MKNYSLYFVAIYLFSFTVVYPQASNGASLNGIANSGIALASDIFTNFNNPSASAYINKKAGGIFYSPAPFGMSELANGAAIYSHPFSFGNMTIGITTYGYELYRENRLVFGYSKSYQNKYFFGVNLNYHTLNIVRYGSDNAFYVDAGFLLKLSEQFRFAFGIHNLNRATWGNEKDQIPIIFETGISYDLLNNISLNVSLEKELTYLPSVKFGVDYRIIEYLSLRTGFNTEPSLLSGGIGIHYSNFQFDYAVVNHQDLGFTHSFGVLFALENLNW